MYKLLLLIVAICGQSATAATREKKAAQCIRVDERQLGVSKCTRAMKHTDSNFLDLTILLADAQGADHAPRSWWQLSANYLTSHSGSTSRSSFPSEDELMVQKINSIFNDSHPACVQWLIEHYRDYAAHWWKSQNPQFPDPNNYKSATTISSTRTTTTTVASTATTTPLTTSTTITTSTSRGVSCTTCTDLDCLLAPRVVRCPPDSSFCLITISDSGHSRSIARGCADQAKCDSIRQAADCAQVESAYHSGTVCEFCCSVDNCNRPPYLVPQPNTRYPQP